MTVAVRPRGVEEIAAERDRAIERRERFAVVAARPPGHAPHAVADLGDLPSRASQRSILHPDIICHGAGRPVSRPASLSSLAGRTAERRHENERTRSLPCQGVRGPARHDDEGCGGQRRLAASDAVRAFAGDDVDGLVGVGVSMFRDGVLYLNQRRRRGSRAAERRSFHRRAADEVLLDEIRNRYRARRVVGVGQRGSAAGPGLRSSAAAEAAARR